MSERLLSKSLATHSLESDYGSAKRSAEHDSDDGEESRIESLLKTRIPSALQTIGNNLDRALSVLQRMERKLEAEAR